MKSKTKIEEQIRKKGNKLLVDTIITSKKNKAWFSIADILSSPRRVGVIMNLNEINKEAKDGETVLIPGKVLSQGEINKKIKIIALKFSENAKEKLSKSKIVFSNIDDEIKKNPDAKGIRILK